MVSRRAAERFDALSTRTGELDDRSNPSLPGRPRLYIQPGLLLEDPHSAISKTNGRGDENHWGITRNWRQYAEVARGLRGYGTFNSAEVFATAFAPHAAELQADAPHYTNIQPFVQISEVLMG